MVYFAGPTDVWSYFRLSDVGMIDRLNEWIDRKCEEDPEFKAYIHTGDNRFNFVRYYAVRGSVAYSKGAHDEWNIVAALKGRSSRAILKI